MKHITFRLAAITVALALSVNAVASAPPAPVVNINTATEAQLAFLPGVGSKVATAIYTYAEAGGADADDAKCDHRCHFKTIDDLRKVKGIGAKKLEALRPYVVLTGATTATAKIKTAKGGAK
jgi:competence protein ComEA